MIICVCNALSDAQCSAAACRPECATVGCVYRHLGARVRCGKCVPMMADLFRRVRAADAPRGDPAGADAAPPAAVAAAVG
jgi:bacterioferritin-associated ferredoxin